MNNERMSAQGGSALGGKTKNYLKNILATTILLTGFLASPILSMAADVCWGVGLDSAGGISASAGSCDGGGGWMLSNPANLPSGSILGIVSNFLFWLLAIFSVVGIIGFVLSGIFYLLAGADEGMAEKGKDGMKWSIIGIIVGLSGYIIMQAVSRLLAGGGGTNY